MTHFLFLEKGAALRDSQRSARDKGSRDPLARRTQETPDSGEPVLFLMLPTTGGYRLFRAALEEVGDPADLPRGGADRAHAELFERLLRSATMDDLSVRLPAHARRSGAVRTEFEGSAIERFGNVEIDVAARVVRRDAELVPLAPMEFDLLLALARRDGAAASRRDLLRDVWGTTRAVSLRTVDTHVSNLRRKLEVNPSRPRHILTVKKVGYRLQR